MPRVRKMLLSPHLRMLREDIFGSALLIAPPPQRKKQDRSLPPGRVDRSSHAGAGVDSGGYQGTRASTSLGRRTLAQMCAPYAFANCK